MFVRPVRPVTTGTGTGWLHYNSGSGELTYDNVTSKTFVIDHPVDRERYLVHACLEGPEAGVYYRGEGVIREGEKYAEVSLPSYADALAKDFTVHLTSVGCDPHLLSASRVENGKFRVYGGGKFSWLVYGKRANVEVEPLKRDTEVKGDGPYRWI